MRNAFRIFFLLILLSSPSACAYSHVIRPLDDDVSETRLGSKVGRATARSVAFLVAWGDAGVAAAAEEGGLTQVNHLDMETYIVLFGLYTSFTTIAYGD